MSYIKFLKDEHDKIMQGGSYLFTGDEEIIDLYNIFARLKHSFNLTI